ncbi:SubName: Full=Uncharacterized protein {ECO:0000313/EMBL:CCA72097.1} [Serendipita indica DSM 11827]|nr:SubName: Full=Uncharacterized protein {ECO:0000313/EMBL:CCA72097.1} [Serendipita indica DSM 11827]
MTTLSDHSHLHNTSSPNSPTVTTHTFDNSDLHDDISAPSKSGLKKPNDSDTTTVAVPTAEQPPGVNAGPVAPATGQPVNIESTPVEDDPRQWSRHRKLVILAIISFAALAPTTGAFIYQPAIQLVERDLHATTSEIALSLSLFILVQGNAPLAWSSISEIKGRRFVYIIAMIIFIVGSAVGGASKQMPVLICMRMLQAAGSSAVLSLGAGTLADIYAPHERGSMLGIYYAAPLLGPSLGPVVGGALSQAWSWRATFYFLTIIGVVVLISMFMFRDTFRQERSLTYQSAKRHAIRRAEAKLAQSGSVDAMEKATQIRVDPSTIRVTLVDLNPFKPIWNILRRKNNLAILLPSALLFAFQYSICFTAARTFAAAPYHYDPLKIGLILLSFGFGNMCGSVLGGRWSDHTFAKLKEKNNGQGWPEMRLNSTKPVMIILPPTILAFAWTCQKHTHIAGPVVSLFFAGFAVLFIYSSTLAYVVDANAGRSTAAVASNSSARGISGLIAAEIAAPIQDAIGDGGLYSIWAGLVIVMELMILLVIWRGKRWREEAERQEQAGQTISGSATPIGPNSRLVAK